MPQLLHEAGLQPLNIRRKYFGLCQYFKIVNCLVPDYLTKMLPRHAEERQRYNIRNRNEFLPTFTRKSPYAMTSFFWNITDDWNALDSGTRISKR